MAFDITPYINMKPRDVRQLIREGKIDFPTAGMCAGYAQANLVILPPDYAADFEEYTKLNPFPCPVLEIIRGKEPLTHAMGEGANISEGLPMKTGLSSSSIGMSPCEPSSNVTSTSSPSPCSSFTRTLKLSGTPGFTRL